MTFQQIFYKLTKCVLSFFSDEILENYLKTVCIRVLTPVFLSLCCVTFLPHILNGKNWQTDLEIVCVPFTNLRVRSKNQCFAGSFELTQHFLFKVDYYAFERRKNT